MAAAADDEETIKTRLRSREVVFEKAVKKFLVLTKQADPAEATRAFYSLMGELDKYELDMSKTQLVYASNQQEVATYQQMTYLRNKEIEQTRAGIESLKKDLEQARLHRKHLEEYDVLARMINTLPTRHTTEQEILELNKEIEALEREAEAVAVKVDMRGKQFQLLLFALNELHAELYDEEQEESERATKRAREEEEAKARAEAAQQAEAAEVVLLDAGERDAEHEREDRSQPTRTEARAEEGARKEEDGELEDGAVEPMDASGV